MNTLLTRHGCALLLLAATPGLAAPPLAPEQADAPAATPHYPSAFADYTPFRQTELEPWSMVNGTVRELGGHGGHMPAMNDASPTSAHGGHTMEGQQP
ncbi:MAG: hypothetical protein AB1344_01315 [Pseudomonadota bacterium]